ncbi:DUF6544 family protein [Mucilaginibacter sp.]|uniref:DUF6544 family protein n=1 Tax=Mucilaginibacter sp. TaxID=1882438 RepID=UPI0031B61BAD
MRSVLGRPKISRKVRIFPNPDRSGLPEILQQYIARASIPDLALSVPIRIAWKNTALKFKPVANWSPVNFEQINFLAEPVRLIHMWFQLWGLIPKEGMDSYLGGKGRMLVRLLKHFKMSDVTGPKMDQPELVTLLAETMLIPAYRVQQYMQWKIIDRQTIEGTITHRGISASGIFLFQ